MFILSFHFFHAAAISVDVWLDPDAQTIQLQLIQVDILHTLMTVDYSNFPSYLDPPSTTKTICDPLSLVLFTMFWVWRVQPFTKIKAP